MDIDKNKAIDHYNLLAGGTPISNIAFGKPKGYMQELFRMAALALERQRNNEQKEPNKEIEVLHSICHWGGMCEFCGADCISAGTEDAETSQCGSFIYSGRELEEWKDENI